MRTRLIVLSAILFALVLPASAQSAEVSDVENKVPPIEDATFEIFDLSSSTQYELRAVTSGGTSTINSFQTNNAGDAKLTIDLRPVERNTELTDKGYQYAVYDNNGNKVSDVYTSYGASVFALDTFYDGDIAYDNFDFVPSQASEDSNDQLLDLNYGDGFSWTFDSDKTSIYKIYTTGSNQHSINGNIVATYSSGFYNTCANNAEVRSTFLFYYNDSSNQYVAEGVSGDCDGKTFTTSAPSSVDNLTVSVETGTTTYDVEEWYIAPKNSKNLWLADPSSLNISLNNPYEFVDVLRYGKTGADLRYSDNGATFTAFTQDLDLSSSFNVLNINNETVQPFTLDLALRSPFSNLKPDDGDGTNGDTFEASYVHSTYPPNEDDDGEVSLQFYINGQWQTVSSTVSSSCKFLDTTGDKHLINNEDCSGESIQITKDISNYQGDIEWRLRYQDNFDLLGDFPTVYSEERTFQRVIQEPSFNLNLPIEGSTVTTLRPSFQFGVRIFQEGNLQLQVKEDQASSWTSLENWVIGNKAQRAFSFTPNTGLTDNKDYDWRAVFSANTGQLFTSDSGNFSINTSEAGETNITLESPNDNQLIKNPDVTLNYTVETSQPVSVRAYLNGNEVSRRQLSAGDHNVTTQLLGLDPDSYQWYITANNSNTYYQSNVRNFQISEDVSIDLYTPRDGDNIDRPPIIFNSNISTEVSGEYRLLVDNNLRDTVSVPSGDNQSIQFELRKNISEGRHSWRTEFESSSSRRVYSSNTRTFDLNVGVQDGTIQKTGQIGDAAASVGQSIFGLQRGEALSFFSIFISILVASFIGIETRSGEVAGLVSMLTLSAFTIIGWFPSWLTISLAVVAAAVFASRASSGRI